MQSVFTGPELLSRWCNLGSGPVFGLVINGTFALWLTEKVGTVTVSSSLACTHSC